MGIIYPDRRTLPHGRPSWLADESIYFITICCVPPQLNQLAHAAVFREIVESIEFRIRRSDWFVWLLLLMPDHLHALMKFNPDRDMRTVVSAWKGLMAKRCGIHWQRDFFDHRLRNRESFEEKAHYIRLNPVRKGLVAEADAWPFVWEPGVRLL